MFGPIHVQARSFFSKMTIVAFLAIAWLTLGVASAAPNLVTNRKISVDPAAQGGVSTYRISPDGQSVVYLEYQSPGPDRGELFSAPLDGSSSPVRLSKLLPNGVKISDFLISANSQTVVYRVDQDELGKEELYSVSIQGGPIIKLNHSLENGEDVTSYRISETNDRVIYQTFKDASQETELYAVPIAGGHITQLVDASALNGGVVSSEISQDGTTVVYLALENSKRELFSIPITGSASATKLNGTLTAGGGVAYFEISPDSAHVIYRADQDVSNQSELYSVPIGGGTAIKLNNPLIPNGDVGAFEINSTGTHVVFRADQNIDHDHELYSVSITGGTVTRLSAIQLLGGNVPDFSITPDGSRVIFRFGKESSFETRQLYTTSITGGGATRLDTVLTFVTAGSIRDYRISPDSASVVFSFFNSSTGKIHVYATSVYGAGTLVPLNGELEFDPSAETDQFKISSDSAQVIMLSDTRELFTTPITGSNLERLNGVMVSGGTVNSFQVSPIGSHVVYWADQQIDGTFELYLSYRNTPPQFGSITVPDSAPGTPFSLTITADDPDIGESLTLQAISKPSWLAVIDNGNGTATLSGTPGGSDMGTQNVTLRVTDSAGAFVETTFSINVRNSMIYLPLITH